MKRRTVMSAALAAAVGGAGCLDSADPQARVSWVAVRNDHDREYDATISLAEGGETAFSETQRLGTDGESATFRVESPVSGAGDYVIRATVDGEPREVTAVDHVDGDEDCLGVQFLVTDGGSFLVDTIRAMQQC